jgi:thioredoxin-related protein
MKFFAFVFFLVFTTLPIQAQQWENDFATAKKIAAQKDQPILLVFKGSDWCAPCIKLDKAIFTSEAFIAYAKENVVLLEADFPKKKANVLSQQQQTKNNALAEQYNRKGIFPLVVALDKIGNVLGTTGYSKNSTPEIFIKFIDSL